MLFSNHSLLLEKYIKKEFPLGSKNKKSENIKYREEGWGGGGLKCEIFFRNLDIGIY